MSEDPYAKMPDAPDPYAAMGEPKVSSIPKSRVATISAAPPAFSKSGIEGRLMTLRDEIINQLPTVGGTIGGIIGAGAGAETGPGALGTAALGAAAGGGLGETARQSLTEHFHPEDKKMTPAEALKGIGEQTAGQGAAEAAGGAIGRAVAPSMIKAIQRLYFAGNLGPKEELEAVMPEIVSAEKVKPVKTVGDFVERVGEIKDKIGNEVNTSLRTPVTIAGKQVPLSSVEASGQPIADRITNLIQNHPSDFEMNPAKIKAIKNRAVTYGKPHTYGWLNDRRIVLNDELNKFYALKTPADKAQYLSAHPDFEIDKAEADAIRDVVYPEMDRAARKPSGYFEGLQKKRGALRSIERQADEHLQDLKMRTKRAKGAPIVERPRAYATNTGRIGLTTRLASILPPADLEKRASKQVSKAFAHKGTARVGKLLSTQTGKEVMALPLRELFNPDQPQQ